MNNITNQNNTDNSLSIPDMLTNFTEENCSIFQSQDGESYVIIPVSPNQKKVVPVGSSEFEKWLRYTYRQKTGKTVCVDQLKRVSSTIDMIASTSNNIKEVATRIHHHQDCIYYDLHNENSDVIRISKNSVSVVNNSDCSIAFLGNPNMKMQLSPNLNAKASDLLELIPTLFCVSPSDILLFTIYLTCCFIPNISHPVLIVHGEKGSSKSTALKITSDIVSPSKKNLIPLPSIKDLPVTLNNGYFIAFDNLRTISPTVSDILCMAVTGGSISKRKLFSDNNEVVINIKRIVAMDGINIAADQPDLLDRSVLIHMQRIADEARKTDLEIESLFKSSIKNILGACFDAISKALTLYDTVSLKKLPRMADFAKFGYCIAESMKEGLGEQFLQDYDTNSKQAAVESIQNNPLIDCITLFMYTRSHWIGSVSQLFLELKDLAQSQGINTLHKQFPKAPNYVSKRLNEYKSDLHKVGIEYCISHAGQCKKIKIINRSFAASSVSSENIKLADNA